MTPPYEPDLGPDSELPEVPIGTMTPPFPSRPPNELTPTTPGTMTPPYPNEEELNPSAPPAAPEPQAPLTPPLQELPPSEFPPPPTPQSPSPQTPAGGGSSSLPAGVVLGVVAPLPAPAPGAGQAATQVDAASEAASREFEAILQRQRIASGVPGSSAGPFDDLLRLPRRNLAKRVASRAPKVWPMVGDILGGELGVILPTVLFPNEARRAEDAAREAAVQKAIARANRRPTLPPWTSTSSPDAPISNSRRPIAPAPGAPPDVPSLPGLSSEQLSKVLGERPSAGLPSRSSASGLPDVVGPEAARHVGGLGSPVERSTRRPKPRTVPRGRAVGPLDVLGRPQLPVRLPRQPESLRVGPDASADVSTPQPLISPNPPVAPPAGAPAASPPRTAEPAPIPRPIPRLQPLTATNDAVLQPPRDRCRCERPTPRPSNKVPTVKSYKRRMSQNSLDNLRRG